MLWQATFLINPLSSRKFHPIRQTISDKHRSIIRNERIGSWNRQTTWIHKSWSNIRLWISIINNISRGKNTIIWNVWPFENQQHEKHQTHVCSHVWWESIVSSDSLPRDKAIHDRKCNNIHDRWFPQSNIMGAHLRSAGRLSGRGGWRAWTLIERLWHIKSLMLRSPSSFLACKRICCPFWYQQGIKMRNRGNGGGIYTFLFWISSMIGCRIFPIAEDWFWFLQRYDTLHIRSNGLIFGVKEAKKMEYYQQCIKDKRFFTVHPFLNI